MGCHFRVERNVLLACFEPLERRAGDARLSCELGVGQLTPPGTEKRRKLLSAALTHRARLSSLASHIRDFLLNPST